MVSTLITVVETASYLKDAERLLTEGERRQIVTTLATDPECGVLIRGGGGIRKMRVAFGNRGKRSGARVIYYYHSQNLPVFALVLFAKNERSDLSDAETKALAKAVKQIPKVYGER